MPALCSFTDLHNISLLLYKSPAEFWFKNYPYVYSKAIFSSSFDEDAFYQSLFESFCNEHSVKLADCDVLLTGFLEAPQLGMPAKLTKSLYEVFAAIKDNYPILINNTSIFSPDFCFSTEALKPRRRLAEYGDVDEDNYYANLAIYPQIITNEIATQIDLDSNVSLLLKEKTMFRKDLPLVFCGSRFSKASIFPELDHLVMLDLIREPGIYEVKRDTHNSLILSTLLNIYDQKINIQPDVEKVATVISSPSSIECIIQPSQLIQLEKGKTKVVPLAMDEKIKLMVKSHHMDTIEKEITGGGLGLILDTREIKRVLAQDIGIFSASLKSLKSVARPPMDNRNAVSENSAKEVK